MGYVIAGDVALGVQLVWKCVAGQVLQHCRQQRGQAIACLHCFIVQLKANCVISGWRQIPVRFSAHGPTLPNEPRARTPQWCHARSEWKEGTKKERRAINRALRVPGQGTTALPSRCPRGPLRNLRCPRGPLMAPV